MGAPAESARGAHPLTSRSTTRTTSRSPKRSRSATRTVQTACPHRRRSVSNASTLRAAFRTPARHALKCGSAGSAVVRTSRSTRSTASSSSATLSRGTRKGPRPSTALAASSSSWAIPAACRCSPLIRRPTLDQPGSPSPARSTRTDRRLAAGHPESDEGQISDRVQGDRGHRLDHVCARHGSRQRRCSRSPSLRGSAALRRRPLTKYERWSQSSVSRPSSAPLRRSPHPVPGRPSIPSPRATSPPLPRISRR